MAKSRALRLLREKKLADLVDPPREGAVFEASGVMVNGGHCFVVLDNVRRVVCVGSHLRAGSADHRWVSAARLGEGYEAIAHSRRNDRFYMMIEAQKHPDGTFKGAIEEYDGRWRFRARRWVEVPFEKRNTGFEGLASLNSGGEHYLLALCEGNRRGRIHVLHRRGRLWRSVARIKLPPRVRFKDYAGITIRGDRLAVVSQESSRLWVGRLRAGEWRISGPGRVYDFPRTKKGRKLYYTVEGISWISQRTLVAVSDLRKKRHPKRSERTDQSIHVFRIPR